MKNVLFFLLLLMSWNLQATHDESTDGDLSNDATSPTVVVVTPGSNVLTGSTINANDPMGDPDYFSFTIPAGHELTSIDLLSLVSGNVAFFALAEGNSLPVPTGAGDLLGFTHLGDVQGDQLAALALGVTGFPSPVGFANPLPAGTYTFWIQETSPTTPSDYSLDFVISAIPTVPTLGEWTVILLMLILLVLSVVMLRQKKYSPFMA